MRRLVKFDENSCQPRGDDHELLILGQDLWLRYVA